VITGRGKNGDPSFHLSIHEGRDIPLMNIMGGVKLDGGTKTTIVLNPGLGGNSQNLLSQFVRFFITLGPKNLEIIMTKSSFESRYH